MTFFDTTTDMQASAVLDTPAKLPAAVFWDMDGTLIDSEVYWAAAEQYVIERHDGTFSDEVPLRARGQSTPRLLEIVQEYIPQHVDAELMYRRQPSGLAYGTGTITSNRQNRQCLPPATSEPTSPTRRLDAASASWRSAAAYESAYAA